MQHQQQEIAHQLFILNQINGCVGANDDVVQVNYTHTHTHHTQEKSLLSNIELFSHLAE